MGYSLYQINLFVLYVENRYLWSESVILMSKNKCGWAWAIHLEFVHRDLMWH